MRLNQILAGMVVFFLCAFGQTVWGLNGAQLTGFSAASQSLGGAGASAAATDASTMLTNPAGLTEKERSFQMGLVAGFTKASMTSVANPGAAIIHNDDPAMLPTTMLILSFMEDELKLGIGAFGLAGFGNDWSASPLGGAFGNNSLFGFTKLVSSAGYRLTDDLSVGVAFHFNRQTLATNGPTIALTQTAGTGRTDASIGVGGSIGFLYKPFDYLHVGTSYQTPQLMQNFERYVDILPTGLNYPQQANFGVAVYPIDNLMIAGDFRWIDWGGAAGYGSALGWQDQFILMGGAEYRPIDPLIVRAGFNGARSAVPAAVTFANSLSSAITKNHVGGGLGFRFVDWLDLDLAYMRSFQRTQTDAGALAAGSTVTLGAHLVNLDATIRF